MRVRETISGGCRDREGENPNRRWLWGRGRGQTRVQGILHTQSPRPAGCKGEEERFQDTLHISRSANWEVMMPLVQIDINRLRGGDGFFKKDFYYEMLHKYRKARKRKVLCSTIIIITMLFFYLLGLNYLWNLVGNSVLKHS